jgi:hypothetical protein
MVNKLLAGPAKANRFIGSQIGFGLKINKIPEILKLFASL